MTQPKRTSASDPGATEKVDEAAERIRELNERIIAQGRKAGLAYLDAYESMLNRMADFQEKAGHASQIDWITELANAQAAFIRDMTAAYTRAARDLLK
jgi:prophage DNA circulation protein